jgi:anti-sigma factor (TIGR02949 family)
MRIDCKHVWEHISSYIDGEIEPELRQEINRHLAHCSICSATLDSTRNIVVLVADERVYEIPAGFSKRLHERLNEVIHSEASDSL